MEYMKQIGKHIKFALLFALITLICITIIVVVNKKDKGNTSKPEIVTISTLEKIIDISELSTFTSIYNGVATVYNKEQPNSIDYYVSYKSKVDVGIDMSKVDISIDEDSKMISVMIPDVQIMDINVDISSLDYIFMNNKANTSSISEEAFKACELDAQQESEKQKAIFELATQNAHNTITALIQPFLEQLGTEYSLSISSSN